MLSSKISVSTNKMNNVRVPVDTAVEITDDSSIDFDDRPRTTATNTRRIWDIAERPIDSTTYPGDRAHGF